MTWADFLAIQQDSYKSIEEELQEPSLSHVIENLINNKYDWAPKNIVFNEQNMPASKIRTNEAELRHVLERVDPSNRQRVDHLHNMVNKPSTEQYMEKYHPLESSAIIATDDTGNIELHDDWALPFKPNVDQVKIGDTIHSQMDFGVADDI